LNPWLRWGAKVDDIGGISVIFLNNSRIVTEHVSFVSVARKLKPQVQVISRFDKGKRCLAAAGGADLHRVIIRRVNAGTNMTRAAEVA